MFFVNPLFLFALFAIAIPIAIHLFNFRKYKIFYFSNTQFLQELKQRTQRQSQLKKIIILSLRIIAITAIVMAFARPFIPLETMEKPLKGNNHVVIYLDNSFSMEGISKRGTLLDEAKDKAKSITAAYAEDDQFMLVTNDFESKHQQFLSGEELKKAIDEVKISYSSPQLQTIVEYALSFLSQRQSDNKKIYLISDFQQSSSVLSSLPKEKHVFTYLVPLKANTIKNLYIDTAWFESPVFQKGQAVTLHAVIRNDANEDVDKLPIKLFVNNDQKAVASADIQADGFAEVKINFTVFEQGIQQAHIDILDYPVSFDDKLFMSFFVHDNYSVMTVYGEKESQYLHALFANDSSIYYQAVNDRNIDYATLKEQDLIVLDQVKEQGSGFMQAIEEYIRQGGNVLIIPSINKDIAINNGICQRLNITRYEALDTQRTRVSTLNFEHPIFNHIFEKVNDNMDMPFVFRFYDFSNGIYQDKQSLIRMENNRDLLCVHTIDKGKVYMLAVPLEDAFSEFHKHALFVPSLYNMAIISNMQEEPYYIIGENSRIGLNKVNIDAENVVEITQPNSSFSFIPEIRNQLSGVSVFVHDQIKTAGNYFICDKEDVFAGLSFNYNRRESKMKFYDMSELEEQIKDYDLKYYAVLNLQHKSTNAIVNEIRSAGIHLWHYFIVLALLCLLAEVLLLRLWKP